MVEPKFGGMSILIETRVCIQLSKMRGTVFEEAWWLGKEQHHAYGLSLQQLSTRENDIARVEAKDPCTR